MAKITADEARRRLEDVLKTVGIKLDMYTCGDICGSDLYIDVEFPDGSKYDGYDIRSLECDGISHRRG